MQLSKTIFLDSDVFI
jgi:hypothetical protein